MSVERMIYELEEFDKKHTKPLPLPLKNWRERWVKAIEREQKLRWEKLAKYRAPSGAWIC